MKNGFIKVAALSPQIALADCNYNAEVAADAVINAYKSGVDIAVFPEMFICGSTCGDLLLNQTLIQSASSALNKFLELTASTTVLCFLGYVAIINGKPSSCIAVCKGGELLSVETNNTAKIFDCMNMRGLSVAAFTGNDQALCERLCKRGATLILNLTAEPQIIGSAQKRREQIKLDSERYSCAYVCANAGIGESTTDLVFSGQSFIAECGEILAESAPFEASDSILISEIDVERVAACRARSEFDIQTESAELVFFIEEKETELTRRYDPLPFIPKDPADLDLALDIQANALARRMTCTYSKKLVLGISGGLDSTLAIIVAVKAAKLAGFASDDVIGITMPCFGTTQRTRSNAEILCVELGVDFRCINIAKSVTQHLSDIGHSGDPCGVAFENAQARERTQILMDLSNMVNGLVVGTGDLSELALGWATYNGDHMSMYSVNADIPKTLIRRMVERYACVCKNERLSAVLRDILDTPVSPELLPAKDGEIAQKTEELLGPYEVHDFLLYHMMKHGFSPKKLFRILKRTYGDQYSSNELKSWLTTFVRRFITQQFKRSCSPDGPKICDIGLSPRCGWHAPSDASVAVWLREANEI